jgi:hypothetical protein
MQNDYTSARLEVFKNRVLSGVPGAQEDATDRRMNETV